MALLAHKLVIKPGEKRTMHSLPFHRNKRIGVAKGIETINFMPQTLIKRGLGATTNSFSGTTIKKY